MCIPAPHASRTVGTTLSGFWMGAIGTACADDARAKAKAAINLSIASSLLLDVLARPAARLRGAVGAKDCTSFLAVPGLSAGTLERGVALRPAWLWFRSGWAIPRFNVPLGASFILRAKQLRYILRADAVIAWAPWVMIFFTALVSFDPTVEYALTRVRWTRGAHRCSVRSPMPPICRCNKAPLPYSTAVVFCIFLGS